MPAGEIATQFDAQSGAVPNAPLPNGGIYFDGLITCVQVYDVALTEEQIRKAAYDSHCVCPGFKYDPHITTLDGRQYSFQGICWYTLVKDCDSATPAFEITAELIPRDNTEEVRTRAVAINVTVESECVLVDKDNVAKTSADSLSKINIVHEGDMAILKFPAQGHDVQDILEWKKTHLQYRTHW
ncbi:hemocytin-like [Saccoglossus kowalevskii]